MIEGQIQGMLVGRGKQLSPMAVDLVTAQGSSVNVSAIKANDDNIDRYCIQA